MQSGIGVVLGNLSFSCS